MKAPTQISAAARREAVAQPPVWLWSIVSVLFLVTGAAGLFYELVWTRWFERLLGSSTEAAIAVVAAFMGGLAIGGAIFGRIADRTEKRLSLYGWLEIGVGLYAVALPALLSVSTGLYVRAARPIAEHTVLTFGLRFAIAFVLVLVPTTLMGGTLPILARHLAAGGASVGRGVAWLYFVNSAGAAAGCLLAGYVTIRLFGLVFSSTLAVIVDVVAGISILWLRKYGENGAASGAGFAARRSAVSVGRNWTIGRSAPIPGDPIGASSELASEGGPNPEDGTQESRTPAGARDRSDAPAVRERDRAAPSRVAGDDREMEPAVAERARAMAPAAGTSGRDRSPARWTVDGPGPNRVVLAAFLSGAAAMAYEIVWFRLLALVLGSTSDAFTVMLATFIGGLALGSLWAVGRIDLWARPARSLFYVQASIGLLVLGTMPLTGALPELSIRLRAFAVGSYGLYQVLEVLLCAIPLAGPTLLLGASFPLLARLAAESAGGAKGPAHLGSRLGGLVAGTTAGNIAGTLAAGLVTIPTLGTWWTAVLASISSLAAGGVADVSARNGRGRALRLTLVAAAAAGLALLAPGWNARLLIGAPYRVSRISNEAIREFRRGQREREITLLREDAGGTVSVEKNGENLTLRVNGKPDASLAPLDMLTQRLLGHYPMLFHPAPKRVMIVGLGSGVTAGAILRHPVEAVTVAEISRGVVEASRLFEKANHAFWKDPRLRVRIEDARNVLLIEPATYDVVVSEPSNIWMAGVANLYTQEFYRLVLSRLRPRGILVQWVHSYEMSEEDLRLIFRTLLSVFPHATAFRSAPGDLQILASAEPFDWNFGRIETALARPEIRADLEPFGLTDLFTLLTQQEIPEEEIAAYAGEGFVHVDDWPVLETSTPRSLFMDARVVLPELTFRVANPHALVRRFMAGRQPTPLDLYRFARAASLAESAGNISVSALERAIEGDPTLRPAYYLLAETLARRERFAESVTWLERLTTATKPEAEDYGRIAGYDLEQARRRVGFFEPFDPSQVRHALGRCLALDPANAPCLNLEKEIGR